MLKYKHEIISNSPSTMASVTSSSTAGAVANKVNDSFDIALAPHNNDTCHVMIQVDPEYAPQLDFEGASGAIGRFECTASNIVLDCKGYQYQGTIHPGPTVMILSHTGGDELKVDAMTNEFVTLSQIDNVMEKLNAVVVQGSMDDGYKFVDENVNYNKKAPDDKATGKDQASSQEQPKKRSKTEKAAPQKKGAKTEKPAPKKAATKKAAPRKATPKTKKHPRK